MRTECVRGGTVRSGQGVNVPAERLSLPAVTERDREGLARALDLGVDLVAQSFVRGPQDINELRALMGDRARADRREDRDEARGGGHRRDPRT